MIDKQIIDGVDVSGCELYRNDNGVFAPDGTAERTELCYLTNDYCGNSPNCSYKNWKRKEQECERLKQGYAELTDIVSPYMDDFTGYNEELGGFDIVLCVKQLLKQLNQLKVENDDLKKIINEAKNSKLDLKSFLVGEAVQNEYEQQLDQLEAELEQEKALKETYLACYKAKHEDIEGKLFKLSKTLAEIKEIAEKGFKHSQCNCGAKTDLDLILQKMSESDVNNDK